MCERDRTIAEVPAYSSRFLTLEAAEAYAQKEYGAESYASGVWAAQAPLVRSLLQEIRQQDPTARHFDFACGTGRLTQLAEEVFAQVDALDISPAMVDGARAVCRKARFAVGDILKHPDLCLGPYASVTTFRLILNLDPPLRVPILAQLGQRLKPGGKLIFNVHGNRHSLRQPVILWKRWRRRHDPSKSGQMLNDMSRTEVEECLATAGFRIEQIYGTGILPPTVYRWPLSFVWRGIDFWLSGLSWLKHFSIDLIFVCKRKDVPVT